MSPVKPHPFAKSLERFEEFLWIALLAGAPLWIMPRGLARESFLMPKVFFAESMIVLIACLAILLTLLGRRLRIAFSPAAGLLVVFALWHAISIFWAESRSLAIEHVLISEWMWHILSGRRSWPGGAKP